MEPGRMPLPATWYALPNVGAAGVEGPGAIARAHTQVDGLLWSRQLAFRKICPFPERTIRCGDVRSVSEKALAASLTRHAHGDRAGQCTIPPCHFTGSAVAQIQESVDLAVSATVQPTIGSSRARVEAGTSLGDTQSVLPHLGRIGFRRRVMFRPVEKTQFCAV